MGLYSGDTFRAGIDRELSALVEWKVLSGDASDLFPRSYNAGFVKLFEIGGWVCAATAPHKNTIRVRVLDAGSRRSKWT